MASNAPPPPLSSLVDGASKALMQPAELYLSEKQSYLSLIYLRLALHIDPNRDEAWLVVGDLFASIRDQAAARAAYVHVTSGSPEFVSARARIIATYDQPSDNAKALDVAQDTVNAAPHNVEAQILLADQLRANNRFAESAAIFDKVFGSLGDKVDWRLYYMRGAALAQAGQWEPAEKDLLKALSIQPDQPEVLNFLGFSWIDRGVHLQEAKTMVEKAVAANPDSGAMVDSLGWAYYKLGDYAHAVEQLERAAELDGGDPEINDHLGDAYWKLGRFTEARFQWEAVLTFGPSAALRTQVEEKLKTHLIDDHGAAVAIKASASVAGKM